MLTSFVTKNGISWGGRDGMFTERVKPRDDNTGLGNNHCGVASRGESDGRRSGCGGSGSHSLTATRGDDSGGLSYTEIGHHLLCIRGLRRGRLSGNGFSMSGSGLRVRVTLGFRDRLNEQDTGTGAGCASSRDCVQRISERYLKT